MSIFRKIGRGHATFEDSPLFGLRLVTRNGRGRLQYHDGTVLKHRPIPAGNFMQPKGKPSATENQRKKVVVVHRVLRTSELRNVPSWMVRGGTHIIEADNNLRLIATKK